MIFEFVKKENKRGLSKSQIEHTVHKIKEGSSSLAKLKKVFTERCGILYINRS